MKKDAAKIESHILTRKVNIKRYLCINIGTACGDEDLLPCRQTMGDEDVIYGGGGTRSSMLVEPRPSLYRSGVDGGGGVGGGPMGALFVEIAVRVALGLMAACCGDDDDEVLGCE